MRLWYVEHAGGGHAWRARAARRGAVGETAVEAREEEAREEAVAPGRACELRAAREDPEASCPAPLEAGTRSPHVTYEAPGLCARQLRAARA